MSSFLSTGGIARASARHPWRALGGWLLLIVIAAVLSSGLGNALDDGADFTNTPESKRGSTLIDQRMGAEALSENIVVTSETLTVDDAAFQAAVEQTTAGLRGMTGVVDSATSYFDLQAAGDPASGRLISEDRHTALIPVTLAATADTFADIAEQGDAFIATAQSQAGDGIEIYAVGDLSGSTTYGKIADEDLSKDISIGLPVAALVLVFVFGALVAAGLPLLLGIVSIFVAMGLTALMASVFTITSQVTIMITMIGLAVGIDYALFVIERYREERRHGIAKHDAIAIAGSTAGKRFCSPAARSSWR